MRLSKHFSTSRHPIFFPSFWLLLGPLVFSNVCLSGCNGTVAPGRKQIGAVYSAHNGPKEQSATTNDLVVYLDTSKPMKGYVTSDGQSVFSQTLRTLREFSTTLSPQVKVHLRKVDSTVGDLQSDSALNDAASGKTIYTGDESNLVGAISYFNQNLFPSSAPSPKTGASVITPPRFHILVTDGVQYSRNASPDGSCSSDSDAFCVRKKILELLNQGWTGAVIGLRSQFSPQFYSEQAHRYVDFKTDGRPIEQHRPFYLFIFSPDRAALDNFVVTLKESLRKDASEKHLFLRELPLTANYSDGPMKFEQWSVSKPDDKGKLRVIKINGDSPDDPLLVSVRFTEETYATEAPFTFDLSVNWSSHGKDCGGTQELANVLDWKLEQTYPAKEKDVKGNRYPEIQLTKVEPQENGALRFSALAKWPKTAGTANWRAYHLVARIKPNSVLNWIRDWSTDNDKTTEAGSKTLDLKTTLLGMWRNPVLENQAIAEAYLRIGPQ
jgi:hypothetical protein